MKTSALIEKVMQMAQPVCEEQGARLWDVTFEKEGARYVLTVFIDSESGISIEQCEAVSRYIDPLLDTPEFASLPAYMLSVSSAGLERKITRQHHFEWALGKLVTISFYKAMEDGSRELTAMLHKKTDSELVLISGDMEIVLPLEQVASVRQYFEF